MLAEAAFFGPEVDGLSARDGLPAALLEHFGILLGLGGNLSRYALAILASRLRWLYFIDRDWSDANLLSALDSQDRETHAAFWGGFFWGAGGTWDPRLYSQLKVHLLSLAEDRDESWRQHDQTLANLVLAGWSTSDGTEGGRHVSNEEFRRVLLRADDGFRSAILWHAERWLREDEGGNEGATKLAMLVPELLRDVWPRQRSVKTPAMSARLFGLAVRSERQFPVLAEVVEPLLFRAEGDRVDVPGLRRARNVITEHPRELLGLLYAVLPERAANWSFDTGVVVGRLWEADETMRQDNRLVELRRRWDAR